jgi:GT2 family glycosyltransferase
LPTVAIILLNWNGRDDTLECLESVFRLSYPNFRVVLCDNDSNDDSLNSFQEWADGRLPVSPASPDFAGAFARPRANGKVSWVRYTRNEAEADGSHGDIPELVLIETGANLGFAGGNNVGIRYALQHIKSDFVWLLNTDTIVHSNALSALVERAVRDTNIGMVGSSLVYYWQPDKVQAMGGATLDVKTTRMEHIGIHSSTKAIPENPSAVEARMAYVVGASMLVSSAYIEQVGLMCEDYFLYYEEIDWALRGKGRYTLAYAPESIVFHKVGGASRRIPSLASMRFLYRNRIRFVTRFMPDRLAGTLWSLALDMLRAGLKGRFGLCRVIAETLVDARQLHAETKTQVGQLNK